MDPFNNPLPPCANETTASHGWHSPKWLCSVLLGPRNLGRARSANHFYRPCLRKSSGQFWGLGGDYELTGKVVSATALESLEPKLDERIVSSSAGGLLPIPSRPGPRQRQWRHDVSWTKNQHMLCMIDKMQTIAAAGKSEHTLLCNQNAALQQAPL